MGIISVLRVTNVHAGPKGKDDSQWAKCGSMPMCTYCTGAIVTDEMQKAFESTVRANEASKMKTFTTSIGSVINCPGLYLHPENLDFLGRYVHGGVFLRLPGTLAISSAQELVGRNGRQP